jgi:hypothetical protein
MRLIRIRRSTFFRVSPRRSLRKLAECLPVFALGHQNATVRELSRQLYDKLMALR